MKTIAEFARKPELVQIVLDDPQIIENYGDTVIFYMKEFVDINTYFEFFRNQAENPAQLGHILQKIILHDNGEPVLKPEQELPADLAIAALNKITETLGKSKTKPLMKETGNQPA